MWDMLRSTSCGIMAKGPSLTCRYCGTLLDCGCSQAVRVERSRSVEYVRALAESLAMGDYAAALHVIARDLEVGEHDKIAELG